MPGPVFVPNTAAPTHVGRFRGAAPLALSGRSGRPFLPDVFPNGWQRIVAQFGGTWVDITPYAQWTPGANVRIGYEDESRTLTPASFTVNLRNDQAGGGYFTVDNALSPFSPYVAENTPIEAFLDIGNGESLQFSGYATSWTPSWDADEQLAVVVLTANGVHRRVKQGTAPEKSAIRRLFDTAGPGLVAYYPLEDSSDATTAASGLVGGPAMVATNGSVDRRGVQFGVPQGRVVPTYAGGQEVAKMGTKGFVSLAGGGSLAAILPPGTATKYRVQLISFTFDDEATARDIVMARWYTPGGPFARYDLVARQSAGAVDLIGYSSAGAATTICSQGGAWFIDEWEFAILQDQVGSNVETYLVIQYASTSAEAVLVQFDSRAGTLKLPTRIILNPNNVSVQQTALTGSGFPDLRSDIRFGHVAVWHDTLNYIVDPTYNTTTGTYYSPWVGWAGEPVTARLSRLAAEQGVEIDIVGDSDMAMGFQDVGGFIDLFFQCADVDQGLLLDGLGPGYTYVTRTEGYSRLPSLVLDATGGDIVGGNTPRQDDRGRVNDYTATNPGGGEARFVQADGPLGTTRVGTYDDGGNHRTFLDSDLYQIAAWKVGQGTIGGLRWPALQVQLAKPGTSAKAQQWLNTRPLDRIDALGISPGSNPSRSVALRGWRQAWNSKSWLVTVNTLPYDTYAVTTLAGDTGDTSPFVGWLDADSAITTTDLDPGGTSVTALVVAGPPMTNPTVATYADDLVGLYINLDGLKVGVTAITAPVGGLQTLTLNGGDVLRQVRAGAPISAWYPVTVGL